MDERAQELLEGLEQKSKDSIQKVGVRSQKTGDRKIVDGTGVLTESPSTFTQRLALLYREISK